MRRVDEGALETDGRDPSVPCGLLGGEELSMGGRGDSVRFNPAIFVSDGGGRTEAVSQFLHASQIFIHYAAI